MTLPNLFIPGAAKSATSSLHEYLNQHPAVYMSAVKEPHFFSNDEYYQKGLSEYAKLFEPGRDRTIRGESSTGYMVFPRVIERIKKDIPDPKFIFILRNPVGRAYSHYWWLKGVGYEPRPFRDAFLADKERDPDPLNGIKGVGYRYYYQFGDYSKWLARYYDAFPKESIHILTMEQLKTEPLAMVNACFAFLGLDPLPVLQTKTYNESVVYAKPGLYRSFMKDIPRKLSEVVPQSLWRSFLESPAKNILKNAVGGIVERLSKRQTRYPELTGDERAWVADQYRKSVNDLRMLTGLSFSEWAMDFPIELVNEMIAPKTS